MFGCFFNWCFFCLFCFSKFGYGFDGDAKNGDAMLEFVNAFLANFRKGIMNNNG